MAGHTFHPKKMGGTELDLTKYSDHEFKASFANIASFSSHDFVDVTEAPLLVEVAGGGETHRVILQKIPFRFLSNTCPYPHFLFSLQLSSRYIRGTSFITKL